MPISKTCYFCKQILKCNKYTDNEACTNNRFIPTDDWLYIEQLEKENITLSRRGIRLQNKVDDLQNLLEEIQVYDKESKIAKLLKENEELKKYKEETEKWLGSGPYIYANEDEVNK